MTDYYPALKIVAKPGGSNGTQELPAPGTVEDAVATILEDGGWTHPRDIIGVRQQHVEIQDETPPNPPVEMTGIVVILGQSATDMLTVDGNNEYPFDTLVRGLYDEFDGISIWIDAVAL